VNERADHQEEVGDSTSAGYALLALIHRLLPTVFLLALFVCAAFSAAGAGLVWVYGFQRGFPEGVGFIVRLTIKVLVFAAVTLGSLWALRRRFELAPENTPQPPVSAPETWRSRTLFLAGLLATAALVLPNLTAYPWLAPDESHHLNVARNLAEHGLYASGHPDDAFIMFDPYDSVGAPVIMATATVFRVLGTSLIAARLVVATYFLLLFLVVYFFAKPVFGSGAALISALMMPMTGSSVYLARSLYGEVPALFFVILGLVLWRRALCIERSSLAGLLAGLCFAAAALCKTIILLSVFAFLGALVYDLVTYRRIRGSHVALPALGFVIVFGAWWCYQALAQDALPAGANATLALYQQFLMFGLGSVGRTTQMLLAEPWALLGVVAGLAVVIPAVFRERYDPPAVVLFLIAVLYVYWWVFFTPGLHPRYLWFPYAAAGVFTGVLIWMTLQGLASKTAGRGTRLACAAVLCLFALPAIGRTAQQAHLVHTFDEMQDDFTLAEFVRELPPDTRVATTSYPIALTLNFLAHRHVPQIENLSGPLDPYGIVIVDTLAQPDMPADRAPTLAIGRYAVLKTEE